MDQKEMTPPGPTARRGWRRSALKELRNAGLALGAGWIAGAIGWGILSQKTRTYWTGS
jgi:hypothetical protein